MGGINTASKSNGGIKITELGNELRVDPRQIVAAAKEMAMENAKVPASWVTAGQADRLRAKFGGQGELKAKIERKLRHLESALETPSEAPKAEPAVKSHEPKLGKRTFEADRRSIFGVVSIPHTIPTVGKTVEISSETIKTTSAQPEKIAPVAADVNSNIIAPLPPAKKFLGVTVAPPIRRESGAADPRFGVTVPSPEVEKKEASTAIWGNLNDGQAPVQFSAPVAESKPLSGATIVDEPPVAEPVATIEAPVEIAQKPVARKHSERNAPIQEHQPEAEEATPPAAPATQPVISHPPEEMRRKHAIEVPVKWQPKNKAFGSKVKVKTKLLKKLEQNEPAPETQQKKKKSEPEKKHNANAHAAHSDATHHEAKKHSERKSTHAPEKQDGVFKRIIRSIFKK